MSEHSTKMLIGIYVFWLLAFVKIYSLSTDYPFFNIIDKGWWILICLVGFILLIFFAIAIDFYEEKYIFPDRKKERDVLEDNPIDFHCSFKLLLVIIMGAITIGIGMTWEGKYSWYHESIRRAEQLRQERVEYDNRYQGLNEKLDLKNKKIDKIDMLEDKLYNEVFDLKNLIFGHEHERARGRKVYKMDSSNR